MKRILTILLLTIYPVLIQAQSFNVETNNPLKSFSKFVAEENYEGAKKLLIDESLSNQQLKDLKKVLDKVNEYVVSGVIKPTKEGSKQYSFNLRDSVIFLLEEDGKLYFTKGTTSNIPELLQKAELLSTPEKTMAYFIDKVKAGNLEETDTCFVPNEDDDLTNEEAAFFSKVLSEILSKKIKGSYQGKKEKSIVGFELKEKSLFLAKESGDWLFTLSTKRKIPTLLQQSKANALKGIGPKALHEELFVLKNWQWIGIFLILFAGIVIQWLLQVTFNKTVAKKLKLNKDGEANRKFRSVTILSISLSWYLLFPFLGIDKEVVTILTNAAAIMAMVSALFVVSKILDFSKEILMNKAEETDNKIDDVLIPMFHKLIKLATYLVGIVLIASNIGINVASLLAGIGLAGMAIALAAKDTVENLFGSITVLLDKPFEVGDWVVINGVEGTVEQIGLRSSRIRTFYCSQVNVPNSTLIQATVDNYGRRNYRRIKTMLSLTYDTPPDKIEAFCEGIRELIRNHPYTRKDTYQVYFNNFNAASLDVLLYCFLDTSDWAIELREKQRLYLDIIRLAGRLEVEFAYPTQTIHMANPDQLYPAEKETNIDQINNAIMSGRQLGSDIVTQSVPDKGSVPKSIDFIKGNSYYEGSNKSK